MDMFCLQIFFGYIAFLHFLWFLSNCVNCLCLKFPLKLRGKENVVEIVLWKMSQKVVGARIYFVFT